jgi:hypothetical protein
MSNRKDVSVLEGWRSLPDAAVPLGVTRQRLFQMVDEGKLPSVRQVPGAGSRPAAYVISEAELCRLRREQLQAAIGALEAASDAEPGDLALLRERLAEVQMDALNLLRVQLGAAVEAADIAGDVKLSALLREKLAGVPSAPGCPVCQGARGEVNASPGHFCASHKPAPVGA